MNYEEKFEPGEYGTILIKGTKISLRTILRKLSEGTSIDSIIETHPEITIFDIYACLEYASELVGVIDYNKAMSAIFADKKKRKELADRIRASKGKPSPGWPK